MSFDSRLPGWVLPAILAGNLLSGAVMDVPRRRKLCFTSSEVISVFSPAP